ncbi:MULTISPECIES: hypothetical protein [unclassified Nonomuraea]
MDVTDGRSDQGPDHPAAVRALAVATVVGMKGYRAITGRVADVPAKVMADLYLRAGPGLVDWSRLHGHLREVTRSDGRSQT